MLSLYVVQKLKIFGAAKKQATAPFHGTLWIPCFWKFTNIYLVEVDTHINSFETMPDF